VDQIFWIGFDLRSLPVPVQSRKLSGVVTTMKHDLEVKALPKRKWVKIEPGTVGPCQQQQQQQQQCQGSEGPSAAHAAGPDTPPDTWTAAAGMPVAVSSGLGQQDAIDLTADSDDAEDSKGETATTAAAAAATARRELDRGRHAARVKATAAAAAAAGAPRRGGRSGRYRLQQLCDDLTTSTNPKARQQLQLVVAWAQAICKGAGADNPLAPPAWLGRNPKLMLVQVGPWGVRGAVSAVAFAVGE
jgi:hypothetical protein